MHGQGKPARPLPDLDLKSYGGSHHLVHETAVGRDFYHRKLARAEAGLSSLYSANAAIALFCHLIPVGETD